MFQFQEFDSQLQMLKGALLLSTDANNTSNGHPNTSIIVFILAANFNCSLFETEKELRVEPV